MEVLIGALVGGLLSFLGTFYAHKWNMEKEREQWDRQQKAEADKSLKEESKLAKMHLLEAYTNAIHYLTRYVTEHFRPINREDDEVDPMSPEEETQHFLDSKKNKRLYYLETQKYLLHLSLFIQDIDKSDLKTFEEFFNSFVGEMEDLDAWEFRNFLVRLVKDDRRLKGGVTSFSLSGLPNSLPPKPVANEIG
jgi:hypothetical protein